jgi:glycosyltransferase involved in cell wall biosynthesis
VGPGTALLVYNGVDLDMFSPVGPYSRPEERWRILLVEGNLSGGYESGLEMAVSLGEKLCNTHHLPIEIEIVGGASPILQSSWQGKTGFPLRFRGKVPRQSIPEIDRSAHVLFAADVNAACPNSVLEALGCGLPVVSFDTGALPELVQGEAGVIVPYGGDPWKLDAPDIAALAGAVEEVLRAQARYRPGARQRAEQAFGLDRMVEAYIRALEGD